MLYDRLSKLATAASVSVMFFSLMWLQPQLLALSASHFVTGTLAAGLAAAGISQLLVNSLLWLFGKYQPLRKVILGKTFLEGTWVGCYVQENQQRFTLEHIDQTSGTTVIRGREFDSTGKTRASWSSDTVSIDIVRMQLVYAYTCKVFDRKHVQEGLGVFAIVCELPGEPARKLDGYAVDLTDGDRDPNTEHKISDTETTETTDEFAFSKAREIFNALA